jgi:hypothetical protein
VQLEGVVAAISRRLRSCDPVAAASSNSAMPRSSVRPNALLLLTIDRRSRTADSPGELGEGVAHRIVTTAGTSSAHERLVHAERLPAMTEPPAAGSAAAHTRDPSFDGDAPSVRANVRQRM